MELEAELKGLLSDSLLGPENEETVECARMDVERKSDVDDNLDVNSSILCGSPCQKKARTDMPVVDVDSNGKENGLIEFMECQINSSDVSIPCNNDVISLQKSTSASLESTERKKSDDYDNDELMILDPVMAKKTFGQKRKRDSLSRMLCWISEVGKNPCDPRVGSLPEISKWKSFGDESWRQVLLAREATFSKRRIDPGADQLSSQRNQRMHPAMYDDHSSGYRERLRCRESLVSKKNASGEGASFKSSSSNSNDLNKTAGKKKYLDQQSRRSSELSTAELIFEDHARQQVPLGPRFQAVVPEWTGVITESESKWLGTRIWPPEKIECKHLTKRNRVGKGRHDSCGCQVTGSIECVRFHVAEKRLKLREELGPTFFEWKFHKMGEEVGLSWTKDDEKKFKTLVDLNPPSLQKSFWGEIFKSFPKRSKEELFSYYFNVFLLKRRGYQNRVTPNCINSDDEDDSVWDIY